jgi:hypothetical protein
MILGRDHTRTTETGRAGGRWRGVWPARRCLRYRKSLDDPGSDQGDPSPCGTSGSHRRHDSNIDSESSTLQGGGGYHSNQVSMRDTPNNRRVQDATPSNLIPTPSSASPPPSSIDRILSTEVREAILAIPATARFGPKRFTPRGILVKYSHKVAKVY